MLRAISHVQLPVPNVSAAIDWYITHLGFTLESHLDQVDALLNLESGPTLFLWQTRDNTVATFTVNGQSFPTIGVQVSDIATLRDKLAAAGTPIPIYEDAGFGMIMKFFDPYGNMWVACEPH